MKLFKTSLISYLIIFSLIFTQVFPAFAQGLAEQTSQDSQTLEQSCDEDMWQYSPDNIDSIAYVSDEDEGFDETAEGDSDSNGEAAADAVEESEEQATDTAAAQLAADEGEAQAAELFEAEEEQEAAEDTMFEDVSHMSDEEFFGQWDMEREEWVVQGKLNYDYSPDLAEVERLVKNNSYSLAKDALLEYYRNRSNIPRAETNASIGWARNTLNMRDAYSFQETLITYTNITNTDEYQEYTVDLLTDVSSSVFLLSSITKTEDMVSIASRESEYSPKLVIVCEDGTSVTLDPVKDTYIRGYDDTEDYSKNIYGLSKELYVKDSWYQTESGEYKPYSSKTRRAYIGFDSDKFPGDIERMYLKFYAKIVPEEGVETTTETNHEIMVFSAYNKSWDEVKSANNEFDPMNWADYKIAHYSWNGLPGGFDWKRPDNVPSEFFNENSRFYGATSMARSSLMTSDRDYMRKSIEVTLDFIQDTNGDIMVAGVPSGRDIESANRCCEIPGLFAIWLDSDIFDSEAMTAILKWLWEEMTYLHNGAGILYQGATALPTSNNYAETNRGLWHVMGTEGVCTYFPEYADRDMWKEVANERLDVVGHVLVNDDGCYQEATFSYAISMITYFINIYRFMQDSGEVVPDWYVDRIGNFARYIMYVSFPNHTPPKYGEGAPGNTVATLKKYLNLEDDEEIEYVATDGADGVEPPTSAYFQQLKMASSRTGWTTDSSMLLMSAKNGGNHNHKDSLHMMFYARDKELLADTGMTSYDGGHPHFQWQRHTTRSHNTIEIDGTAQRGSNYLYNYSTSSANWNGEASLDLYSSEPVDRIVAWTDATEGFRHYRNVSYIKNHNFLIVSDMVSPEDDEVHSYTQNWHTSAKSTQYNTIDNTTKIGRTNFSGGTNLLIAQANTDNLELTLETGYSADSSNTTKYFCYTQKAAGDIMYNTVLYPTEEGSTTNISVENIDTGVDPAVASAMDINLFKDNEDVLNVFYYNSFEETPSERTFNGYTTDSANVTIEQDVDGIPQFLSMYNGSNVSRDGKSVISSDVVLTDIEVMYDDKAAIITSKDENISSAKLALMAPHEITSVTINGEAADYICTGDTIYINNNELVDFAQDGGYFVHITAVDDKGNKFPITFDIPESCVTSGALAMPACTYSDGAFVVTFGDAVLSSGAKITVGSHTNEDVYAVIGGSKVKITNTIRVGSTQEYADAYVSVDSPALERAREDLVIWTRNVTEFTIGAAEEASGGSSGGGSSGGGSSAGGAISFPKADTTDNTSTSDGDTEVKDSDSARDDSGKSEITCAFDDIDGHWAYDDICYMNVNGFVNGISNDKFAPDSNVTRAEFAAMAVRILGLDEADYSGAFADVTADDWYADVVETAYNAGIIRGADGLFRPNDNITREEMAVILMRVYSNGGAFDPSGELLFADAEDISEWAQDAVAAACGLGLVKGTEDNKFAPRDNTTRAQAAAVFKRLLDAQPVKED